MSSQTGLSFSSSVYNIIMHKHKRSKSPFRSPTSGRGHYHTSPSPTASRSASGRSTPNTNGIASSLEDRRASPAKDSPCHTPFDRRSVASSNGSGGLTPSSTMEGLIIPSLPKVVHINKCSLRKRPPDDPASGWGFVLRGTTSEFRNGIKVYTCHVETVKDSSAAMNAGIKEGDQILSIDGVDVRDFQHSNTVKIFQTKDKLELTLLPSKFKGSGQVRVTQFNKQCLNYLWSLTMYLQSLEIVNVKLPMDSSCSQVKLIDATYLPCLRHLSINHCALEDLTVIDGLHTLRKLESLSFAHNFLSYEAFLNDGPFLSLTSLKKLDLGYNLLTEVPTVIISLYNLETLVLVENNITELPASLKNLKKLTTLCIDGNLLTDIDNCLEHISQLKMVTMADNQLETEPYCIKHQAYVITGIEGNPYTMNTGKRGGVHSDIFLKRTMSARGGVIKSLENTQVRRISSVFIDPPILEGLTSSLSTSNSKASFTSQ